MKEVDVGGEDEKSVQDEVSISEEQVDKDIDELDHVKELIEKSKRKYMKLKVITLNKDHTKEYFDKLIIEYEKTIDDYKSRLSVKDKEIDELNEKIKKLNGNQCNINISYDIYADDPYIDGKELYMLREYKREIELAMSRGEIGVEEQYRMIIELREELVKADKEHEEELKIKDEQVMKIKTALEKRTEDMKKAEKILKEKLNEAQNTIDKNKDEIKLMMKTNKDLKGKIGGLSKQLEQSKEEYKNKEVYISIQKKNIGILQCELKESKMEIFTLKQRVNNLSSEVNEYKAKLNAANIKIHELNSTVLSNLEKDLKERDVTIETLREVIKKNEEERKQLNNIQDKSPLKYVRRNTIRSRAFSNFSSGLKHNADCNINLEYSMFKPFDAYYAEIAIARTCNTLNLRNLREEGITRKWKRSIGTMQNPLTKLPNTSSEFSYEESPILKRKFKFNTKPIIFT